MKTVRMTVLAGVLALAVATSAHAGAKIMATPPALAAYPALQTLYCTIVSLNTNPVSVTIDIMDYFGAVVSTSGSFTLQPTGGLAGSAWGDGSGNGAWCRFTVDGSPKKYRAAALYDNGSAYTTSLSAQ
jgi:hypothetical protein